MIWLHLIGHTLLVLAMGYYLILNLQWYNYKFSRIVLHHHNPSLHIFFLLLPFFAYIALREYILAFDLLYIPALYLWQRKLDKKLVFTSRVKRFFLFLLLWLIFLDTLFLAKEKAHYFPVILPLAFASFLSMLYEWYLMEGFKKEAKRKLQKIDPTIVAITASYGKTSIKNFLRQLLQKDYEVYATPASINTIAGIVKTINEDLPENTQIFIAEAGARERGDILTITQFLEPHYVVVGKIGPQHLEYFRSMENIYLTKLEITASKRLKKAFLEESIPVKERENFVKFGHQIKDVKADLDGIQWDLQIGGERIHFKAPLLGAFNALNITTALLVAHELGVEWSELQRRVAKLQPIPHRLQKIEAGGKLIIDDSFNGNLEGMLASYDLVKEYGGRKVLVTPGIVEGDPAFNIELAKKINDVFDMVIITGKINRKILDEHITIPKIVLENKSALTDLLAKETREGDLILFSNDTPAYM